MWQGNALNGALSSQVSALVVGTNATTVDHTTSKDMVLTATLSSATNMNGLGDRWAGWPSTVRPGRESFQCGRDRDRADWRRAGRQRTLDRQSRL
jgi:hypothetical protein